MVRRIKTICPQKHTSIIRIIYCKMGKQPKCSPNDEWTNKMCYICPRGYYSTIKKRGVLMTATAWINLKMLHWAEEAGHERLHEPVDVKCPEEVTVETEVRRCGWDPGGERGKECVLTGWWKHPHRWGSTTWIHPEQTKTHTQIVCFERVDFVVCGSYLNKVYWKGEHGTWRYKRMWSSLSTWEMQIRVSYRFSPN